MVERTRIARPGGRRERDIAARDSLPEIGALPGRFEVEGVLGRGGMGVVVRARDLTLGRDVAVKILSSALRNDEELRERLVREARAAASLRHPNVVEVFDVDPEAAFLVMELVEGPSLAEVVREEGPLPPDELRRVGTALLDALAAAHAVGVVHRDVKPSNVLIDPSGRVKLTDFGIAFVEASERTREGLFFGTPGYMPPEQAHGRVDARSDVYALGATLFELATGERVHTEERSVEDVHRALLEATSDVGLAAAIATALMHRSADRHPDAIAFRDALLAAPRPETAVGWLRARPVLVAGVCALAIALGSGAGVASTERPEPPAEPEAVAPTPVRGPREVAIAPFVDRSGRAQLAFSSAGLSHLLALQLRGIPGMRLIPSYRLHAEVEEDADPAQIREAARRLGADVVVEGAVDAEGDDLALEVQVRGADGEVLETRREIVSEEEISNTLRAWTGPLATAIVGHAVVVASTPREVGYDRELQRGVADLERHELMDAIGHLEAAIELDADGADAHYYLTIAAWWAGRSHEFVRTHLRAARVGDLDPARRGFLDGLELMLDGRFDRTIEAFTALAEAHPRDRDVLYGLFEAQFHGGRPAEAIESYARVRAADPGFGLGAMHVLDYHSSRGDEDATARTVESLPPNDRRATVGRLANVRRDWGRMIGELTEAIEAHPRRAGTYTQTLILAYLVTSNLTLARAYAARMEEEGMDPGYVAFGLVALAADAERPPGALVTALSGIASRPDPHGRYFQSLALAEIALPDLGREEAERLEELFSGATIPVDLAADARTAIVRLLAAEARGDEALLHAGLEHPHPEVSAYARAVEADAEGRSAAAAQAFAEAADRSSDGRFRPIALYRRARALRAAEEHAATIEVCRDLIEPPVLRWSWVSTVRGCLTWTAEAADALGRAEVASAARARLARLDR